MTYTEFEQQYFRIRQLAPSYRLGQHFINTFLIGKIESGSYLSLLHPLWNTEGIEEARYLIMEMVTDYQWDTSDLQPINELKRRNT